MHSDKGQRAQKHGCQGNMVIEGKKLMCAYAHLQIPTNSFFVNSSFAFLADIKCLRTLRGIDIK